MSYLYCIHITCSDIFQALQHGFKNDLQEITLDYYDHQNCTDMWAEINIDEHHICASHKLNGELCFVSFKNMMRKNFILKYKRFFNYNQNS